MNHNMLLLFLILLPMAGALIIYCIGRKDKKIRDIAAVSLCIIELLLFVFTVLTKESIGSTFLLDGFCGMGISLKIDGFRSIYAGVIIIMWLMTGLFSVEYFKYYRNRNRYYLFLFMTFGATMGVFLSANLYTTFIFFEIMSLTSYTWVAHDEKKESLRAAGTYLAVAIIGGLVMLMGLFMIYSKLNTLEISELFLKSEQYISANGQSAKAFLYIAGALILFGFGAKAGMFPLHIWLPKAHPVAPAPASALLSGILTKSGIFGIIVLTSELFRYDKNWGMVILVLGCITMFGGAVLAIFSIDLKRTLACSSMSQIGFILLGIGMQAMLGESNVLAARGTILHMVNHSLFKLVLFMCAGAVYMRLHKLNLNDIRGYGRNKLLLKLAFAFGGLGLGGIPLFSGYVSKTMLHESIVMYSNMISGSEKVMIVTIEWIFLICGGMTIAYMLKLFVAVFIEKGDGEDNEKKYMSSVSSFAICTPAVLILVFGIFADKYTKLIAEPAMDFLKTGSFEEEMVIFGLNNLKGSFISIIIGILLYTGIVRCFLMKKDCNGVKKYVDRWPSWLDIEEKIFRPLLQKVLPEVFISIFRLIGEALPRLIWRTILIIAHFTASVVNGIADIVIGYLKNTLFRYISEDRKHPLLIRITSRYEKYENIGKIITASISFGMLLICLGLCFTLIYLLGLLI